ncbi:MAG: hypothetical protein M5R38_13225 [Candidatus Methylomirabilis sp.]|nr:hypothetical protein [Candidatus Methylomirabilis sp.]
MKLMISVRDEHEAAAALAGGADIIDVKNPAEGSLGRRGRRRSRQSFERSGAQPLSAQRSAMFRICRELSPSPVWGRLPAGSDTSRWDCWALGQGRRPPACLVPSAARCG